MTSEARSLDKSRSAIQSMFSAVAPRYDLLNRVLSARRDVAWRRAAAAVLEVDPGGLALDLCCGTGDQALAVCRRGARVVAVDFSIPMLGLARRKFRQNETIQAVGVAADSLRLPLPSDSFAAVTVSFGLRNVDNLRVALREILRVLEPGGRTAILEFAIPESRFIRPLYLAYFRHLLPRIGHWLSARGTAYRYLAESVPSFPQRRQFTDELSAAGFLKPAWQNLSGGIVCLYTGARSQ